VTAIASVTLEPGVPANAGDFIPPWYCIVCGSVGAADLLLNSLLFLPLGLALSWAGLSAWRAVLVSLLLSTSIELAQASVIPDRYSNLGDVVWNTLGGGMGAWLAAHWRALLIPSRREARLLSLIAVGVLATVVGTTAWSFRPSIPDGEYQMRRFERCATPAADRGPLLERVRYGEMTVTRERALPADSLRAQWRADALRLTGSTVPASCEDIFSLVTMKSGIPEEVIGVGRDLTGVTFRVRLRAADLNFRQPSLHLPLPYPGAYAADPADITGRFDRGLLALDADFAEGRHHAERLLTPGLGWALLFPFDSLLHLPVRAVSLAWMFLLALPIGFQGGASRRPDGADVSDAARVIASLTSSFAHVLVVATIVGLAQWVAVRRVDPAEMLASMLALPLGDVASRFVWAARRAWPREEDRV